MAWSKQIEQARKSAEQQKKVAAAEKWFDTNFSALQVPEQFKKRLIEEKARELSDDGMLSAIDRLGGTESSSPMD